MRGFLSRMVHIYIVSTQKECLFMLYYRKRNYVYVKKQVVGVN